MKAKVITYKADGNTACRKTMELEQLSDHVFIREQRDFKFIWDVIFEVQGIYVRYGTLIDNIAINKTAILEDLAVNFIKYVNEGVERGELIYATYIEVFRQLGLDTEPLLECNKAYKERHERLAREDRERAEQEREEREERIAKERAERMEFYNQQYASGKYIYVKDFISLLKEAGITIHPRTLHAMENHVAEVSKDGDLLVFNKCRQCVIDSTYELRNQYNKFLGQ